ncbi:MAG TPA: MdtA/MuxA family multidrug efflux RND transporter periplasmic adaptor subunit [Candidatus Acidoferrum sp.]|nr:MdtA/MuxA family multidrug efflux RND transporter periplasmic adaptor subunit [Candidatus Acidoferrum sp.]
MGHLSANPVVPGSSPGRHEPGSKGHRWLWFIALLVVIGVGLWYFRGPRSSTEAQGPAGTGGAGGGRGGRGAGAGAFIVPVVVAAAERGDVPVYFNGLGTVTAFNTVTVHSRVDGQITKINFQEGQFVHQGDDLLDIDARPYQVQLEQAEGQLAKDQAQLRDVQVNYERYQLLYKAGVIPKQQLDTQGSQVGQFEGSIKGDQGLIDSAKLQLVYSHIAAPISGRIGLRLVDVGNIVHASDTNGLLVITQLQPIAVIFALPQDQLPQVAGKLRNGSQMAVEAYDRDDTTKIESGKLLTIDNQIDTTTGTYKLKAVFNNDRNMLFPNQFVNVHLLADVKKNLMIVPASAIQRGPQGTYVYVVQNGNTAKIQTVTVVQSNANTVGLSAGLNAGEMVVVDGQDKLQDGSKVNASTAPAQAPNAQNAEGDQAPPPERSNAPPANSNARRRTQAPQSGHSTGKPQ